MRWAAELMLRVKQCGMLSVRRSSTSQGDCPTYAHLGLVSKEGIGITRRGMLRTRSVGVIVKRVECVGLASKRCKGHAVWDVECEAG